jgi:hypothetical protein
VNTELCSDSRSVFGGRFCFRCSLLLHGVHGSPLFPFCVCAVWCVGDGG